MTPSLKDKKVLVVGASGFIGRNLVEELSGKKVDVSILIKKKSDLILFSSINLKYYIGDLLDYKSLVKATKDIDIVFNASGALPYHKLSEKEYFDINVKGIENLMKASLKNKVRRVIHISTVGVYGDNENNIDETSIIRPEGIYAESKVAGDKVINKYHKKGLYTVIIRPTIAYGPGDTRPVILTLFKLIKKGLWIPIGDGRNHFHTIYIKNLTQALILAATKEKIDGEDFIIGDKPCPTFGDLSNEIASVMHKKLISFYIPKNIAKLILGSIIGGKIDFVTQEKRYKIDKAMKLMGYKPRISLKKGIKETLNWYTKKGLI